MVAALKQGVDSAFAWLVEQHHAMLVRLALRYVPDVATAEDVAQETWLHVLRSAHCTSGVHCKDDGRTASHGCPPSSSVLAHNMLISAGAARPAGRIPSKAD
jgi:Sigma-70 region 2